ncbi:non-ribosomal peptide synthetase [Runella sp.]|uniref:non-ribosomal peptide synthetase n=1 Tax=Runella sp. TaxID=1960881 RepID=UPI003D129BD1
MTLDFQGPTTTAFQYFEYERLQRPVFSLFTDIARKYADNIAIKDDIRQLTYREVHLWAVRVAVELKSSITKGEPIGIALRNDAFFPAAMLASLALGCPYVPLDISLPLARNELIIAHSGLKKIITMSDIPPFSKELEYIFIDSLAPIVKQLFEPEATCDDIAYINYTSGSTGIPKGVFQNQRNLLHDVMQYTNSIHLSARDRLTLFYSPSVSGAIRDIFGSLLNGATLYIKNLKDTGLYDLAAFIVREKITIYHSIPNIFRTFLQLSNNAVDFSSVRLIYLAGDRIFNTDVDLYRQFFSKGCLLYVGIGATEIATIYRQWFIRQDTIISQERIPLGYSVPDRVMALVNQHDESVPQGEIGEIIVSSPYISLGYWNNPQQTRQAFLSDGDIRTFRTGDLGRINADGLLEFMGRKDNQVKINGHRVELSEVEGTLMNHPFILRCAIFSDRINASDSLIAFFMADIQVEEPALKEWLSEYLPAYMIPQRCIQTNEIPLLHNFKNDYILLKKRFHEYILKEQIQQETVHQNADEKESKLSNMLRKTWIEFLDGKSFDENISWKNAGGNSLNAVNFLVQLEAALGTTLPVDWLHGGMKPQEIYAYLRELTLEDKTVPDKVIYFFPPLLGFTENAGAFLRGLSAHCTIRIINYPDLDNMPFEERNWEFIRSFIARQISDDSYPNVGFLSNCSGAMVMNNFLGHSPLSSYWFVGVIDGQLYYKKNELTFNFKQRAIDFLKKGNFISRANMFLITNLPVYQKSMDVLYKRKWVRMGKKEIMRYLTINHTPSYIDSDVWYFECEISPYHKSSERWKAHCKNIHKVTLEGDHQFMLAPYNAKIVQDHIMAIC